MRTIQQALENAVARNDLVTVKALTALVNDINTELSKEGVALVNYVPVDTDAAFQFCLQYYPKSVESLFCWREISPAVVAKELNAAKKTGDQAKIDIITNTIKNPELRKTASRIVENHSKVVKSLSSQLEKFSLPSLSSSSSVGNIFENLEPVSEDGSRLQQYIMGMISKDNPTATLQFELHRDINLFTYPAMHPLDMKPTLKKLMNVAIEKGDVEKYQKYYALSKQVEKRLAEMGISEFSLGEAFGSTIEKDGFITFNGLSPAQEKKLLFLANQHPDALGRSRITLSNDLHVVLDYIMQLMAPADFRVFVKGFVAGKLTTQNYIQDISALLVDRVCYPRHPLPGEEFGIKNTNINLQILIQHLLSNGIIDRKDFTAMVNELTYRKSDYDDEWLWRARSERFKVILNTIFNDPIQTSDSDLQIQEWQSPSCIKVKSYYFKNKFDDPSLLKTFERYLGEHQFLVNSRSCRNAINECLEYFDRSLFQHFTQEQKDRFVIAKHLNQIFFHLTAITSNTAEETKNIVAEQFQAIIAYEATMATPKVMPQLLEQVDIRMNGPNPFNQKVIHAFRSAYVNAAHVAAKNATEKVFQEAKFPSNKDSNLNSVACSSQDFQKEPVATSVVASTADIKPPAGEPPVTRAAPVAAIVPNASEVKASFFTPMPSATSSSTSSTNSTVSQSVQPELVLPEVSKQIDDDVRISELVVADHELEEEQDNRQKIPEYSR